MRTAAGFAAAAADPASLTGRGLICGTTTSRTAAFAASARLVNGGPGAGLGFFFTDAAIFVASLDVLGLAVLFS